MPRAATRGIERTISFSTPESTEAIQPGQLRRVPYLKVAPVTIHRSRVPSDYFTITPNAWARDTSLPWAARGLLTWLLSHATGYKITEELIVASGPSGRDAVRSMIQALEEGGYLQRRRTAVPGGGSTVDYNVIDPSGGYSDALDDGTSDVRPEQQEEDVSAAQPNDGKSNARSSIEDQEKTNTKTSSSLRATRLPDGFMPDEKMRAWFAEEKLAAVIDGRIEHEKFCDYFAGAPGVKGRKQDWPATWRNWMRTAAERAGRRPGAALAPTSGAPYRPSTTDQKVAQTLELGRRLQAMEDAK